MKDTLTCEIRYELDESRQSPGRLTGTLLTYEVRAADRPEIFTRGAMVWPETGITINLQHDRRQLITRTIPFLDGDEVRIETQLPDTAMGRDVATMVREGIITGLSAEFHAQQEGRRGALREIRRAFLQAAGLVDSPSYGGSRVEVRQNGQRRRYWL